LTHSYPKPAIKRNQIVFVFLVTTLLTSLSAVVFLIDNKMNLALASKKREGSSSSSGSKDNGGGSDNSNDAGSTDSTSPPTKETIAPPTEPTVPPPPASTEKTCPDGSTPDANGLCPVLTDNSGQATPDSSSTGSSTTSATIPNKDTNENSTNGGSSGAASLTTPSDSTTDSNINGGSDKNNTPPAASTAQDSSSGTAISTPSSPPNQDTSSSSTSASSSTSSAADTKPSNAKTPQTGVSQSAAIAATNQIINSPGSTIVNQQSIKQSVKINNEINNIIRKNVISSPSSTTTSTTIAEEKPISNLITVKLATTTTSAMSRNAYLPLADVAPYHLIGGHVTANLPSNHLYVVVAQLASSNGAIQHAVVLDMIRSQISNIYETDLGSQISGTNPLTGKQDVVSDITNLFLWNNGNQQVTFVDANAVTMNLIYK
jgi:hypothetical protein